MARSNTGKAAQISWNRAGALAEAADIPAAQARNFISTYRNTPEAEALYNYLDNSPTFRDAFGKRLIKGAQAQKTPPRGGRTTRTGTLKQQVQACFQEHGNMSKPEMEKLLGRKINEATFYTERKTLGLNKPTRPRRPSQGDPTRPVRAGAPNQYLEKKGIPLECLFAIRELERTYGETEVREAIEAIDTLRE
jgi:hypothetical protein